MGRRLASHFCLPLFFAGSVSAKEFSVLSDQSLDRSQPGIQASWRLDHWLGGFGRGRREPLLQEVQGLIFIF